MSDKPKLPDTFRPHSPLTLQHAAALMSHSIAFMGVETAIAAEAAVRTHVSIKDLSCLQSSKLSWARQSAVRCNKRNPEGRQVCGKHTQQWKSKHTIARRAMHEHGCTKKRQVSR